MDQTTLSCREFVEVLASPAPVPGGGGAAALIAAVGTALGNMVGSLTAGKKRYADVEEEILSLKARCDELQEELLDLVEADAAGFEPLARAYGIPKEDPRRESVLEEASENACAVPLRIMELCGEAIECIKAFSEKGSRLAVSDAGCGAAALKAALLAASLNVYINTRMMKNRAKAEELNASCDELVRFYGPMADGVYEDVLTSLRP